MRPIILLASLFLNFYYQQKHKAGNDLDAIKNILAAERKAHVIKNASLN